MSRVPPWSYTQRKIASVYLFKSISIKLKSSCSSRKGTFISILKPTFVGTAYRMASMVLKGFIIHIYLFVYILIYLQIYIRIWLQIYIHLWLQVYIHIWLQNYIDRLHVYTYMTAYEFNNWAPIYCSNALYSEHRVLTMYFLLPLCIYREVYNTKYLKCILQSRKWRS